MSTYVKPQVLVFQEYTLAPSEVVEPLRALIAGPNAALHRYSDEDEKALINVGPYDRLSGGVYTWPERQAGSLVDMDSVKLFMEDALLLYFEDTIGESSGGLGVVTPVAGRANWIKHSSVLFRSNGTQWPRSGLLYDRDVEIGDVVYIRGVADTEDDCDEFEIWTYVDGFAADEVDATIFPATTATHNAGAKLATTTIEQIAGPINCVTMTTTGTVEYNGLADGYVCEKYTVEVVKSSISGCNAARLRITSDSGTDDQDEVQPESYPSYTDIGTRGLRVRFPVVTGDCSLSASEADVESEELVVGQKWEINVCQLFEPTCIEEGDTYTGADNDTYIIEVTKGGLFAELPEVTVTTAKGTDTSGPTVITGANISFPVGTFGLTAQFKDCGNLSSSSSVSASGAAFGIGDDTLKGLCLGDKFYISVATGQNGPIKTLILRDDLPIELQDATDLDLRLFIKSTIEVTEQRLSHPPLTNYSKESTQIVVNPGITAYDATWTKDGILQPLVVWDGRNSSLTEPFDFGIQYVEYREWLYDLSDEINFIDDVANIDDIPGQLDELNPLKWAVYRALQNANGTKVGYISVADPDDLESWQNVMERADGRDDFYNFVPLSRDREVQNLFQAHIESESSPESGNWKAMFLSLAATTEKMVIGKSDADTQALRPTSLDGEVVLATLADNPEATDTQYTLLRVPGKNAGFITYGVSPGDIVRFLFSIDAFGTSTYREFVVDRVLSESSLLLLTGHTDPIAVAQKVEIWHTLEKNEIVDDLVDQAQSFASNRVVAVWPDVVGTGGNAQEGYFLCAALAGLASGVVPHQPLTNVEISGFDDLAARTKDFLSASQMNALAAGGIWIATEDRDGTPHTRHALTTDTLDLYHREEMIRRNVDSISYLFLRRLRPYIGRTNATPTILKKLRYEVNKLIRFLSNNGFTAELGSQLISGEIAKDSQGNELLRIHPLAADRVEIVLNLVVPAPLNNIELHLVI